MIVAATQERRIEPIMVLALDSQRRLLTSKTDLMLRIERLSDREHFDWSDNTFKSGASVVAPLQVLEEISALYSPGWYRLNTTIHAFGFNLNAVTNMIENDTYVLTAIQVTGTDAANFPMIGEIKVGKFVIENRSPISL